MHSIDVSFQSVSWAFIGCKTFVSLYGKTILFFGINQQSAALNRKQRLRLPYRIEVIICGGGGGHLAHSLLPTYIYVCVKKRDDTSETPFDLQSATVSSLALSLIYAVIGRRT